MPPWIPGSIIGICSLLLTIAIFQSNRKQAREQVQVGTFTALVDKVNRLEVRQAENDVKMAIFWKGVSFDAAKILHQPHPDAHVMDSLIDKYLAEQLSGEDLKSLIHLLEVTRDKADLPDGRRLAASQMLRAIHQRYELIEVQTAVRSILAEHHEGMEELGHALGHKKEDV